MPCEGTHLTYRLTGTVAGDEMAGVSEPRRVRPRALQGAASYRRLSSLRNPRHEFDFHARGNIRNSTPKCRARRQHLFSGNTAHSTSFIAAFSVLMSARVHDYLRHVLKRSPISSRSFLDRKDGVRLLFDVASEGERVLRASGRTPVRPELKYKLPIRMPPTAFVRLPVAAAAAIAAIAPPAPNFIDFFRNVFFRWSIGYRIYDAEAIGHSVLLRHTSLLRIHPRARNENIRRIRVRALSRGAGLGSVRTAWCTDDLPFHRHCQAAVVSSSFRASFLRNAAPLFPAGPCVTFAILAQTFLSRYGPNATTRFTSWGPRA